MPQVLYRQSTLRSRYTRSNQPEGRPTPGRSAAPGRRAILRLIVTGAVLLAVAASSSAQMEFSPGFVAARLRYDGGGDWYSAPTALPNLMQALKERTTVPVGRTEEARVSILDPEFFNYPFIFMNGHGNIRFSEAERERLRTYLLNGGFLFADDNYGMDESFRREIALVFPDRPLVELPYDHPIYHVFYELPDGPPKVHEHDDKPSQGFGILDGERVMVFYAYETDIGNGIEDEDVHDNPPEVREQAMRMAINVVIYALTS